VYSGQITISSEGKLCEHCAGDESNEPDCIDARSLDLANMFILGDYLGDAQFCNAIMDDFKSMALKDKCYPSLDAVCCIWKRTSPDCHLRELFLQLWANLLEDDLIGPWLKDQQTPKDFLADLLLFVGKRHAACQDEEWENDNEQWAEKCSFHIHIDDSDKCS
jgi:hypothetical protein